MRKVRIMRAEGKRRREACEEGKRKGEEGRRNEKVRRIRPEGNRR